MQYEEAGSTGEINQQLGSPKVSRFFCADGFTLVEVTLAMALLGFVVVSMVTVLARSLRYHSTNAQEWRLLLASQRSLEDEIRTLTISREVFARRVAQRSYSAVRREDNIRIVVRCRPLDSNLIELRAVAGGGGRRVELRTLVGSRWRTTPGAGRHGKHGWRKGSH